MVVGDLTIWSSFDSIQNATLEWECKNHKTQHTQQQEQLNEAQARSGALHTQTTTLQVQLAKHEVDERTLQSQNASLMSQNSALQKEVGRVGLEKERLYLNYEDLNAKQEQYLADHSTLER